MEERSKKEKGPGRAVLWNAFHPARPPWFCFLALLPRALSQTNGQTKDEPLSGREELSNQPAAVRQNGTCEWLWWNNGSISSEPLPRALHRPGPIQLFQRCCRSALHWSSPCREQKGSVTAQIPQLCPLFILCWVTKAMFFHHQVSPVNLLL